MQLKSTYLVCRRANVRMFLSPLFGRMLLCVDKVTTSNSISLADVNKGLQLFSKAGRGDAGQGQQWPRQR